MLMVLGTGVLHVFFILLKGIFYFHISQQEAELHTELHKYNTYKNRRASKFCMLPLVLKHIYIDFNNI